MGGGRIYHGYLEICNNNYIFTNQEDLMGEEKHFRGPGILQKTAFVSYQFKQLVTTHRSDPQEPTKVVLLLCNPW